MCSSDLGKNMVSRLSDMRMQLSSMEKQRSDMKGERAAVAADLASLVAREDELRISCERLASASHDAVAYRRGLDDELSRITADERSARAEADRETLAYAKLEDQISTPRSRTRCSPRASRRSARR